MRKRFNKKHGWVLIQTQYEELVNVWQPEIKVEQRVQDQRLRYYRRMEWLNISLDSDGSGLRPVDSVGGGALAAQ